MSAFTFLLSLAAVGTFGYSVYYMNTDPKVGQMHKFMAPELKKYGHLKFLTFQCLCIQLVSSLLHLLTFFAPGVFKAPRDFVFNSLAYPIGSIVCYTFWAVWFIMGRDLIFPAILDAYYPPWLNHATHTIIAPINILLSIGINHGKHSSLNTLTCLAYFGFYTGLLYYIKFDAGVFVYRYLETFNDIERIVYFAGTAVLAYVMLKSGNFLTQLAHGQASQRPTLKKNNKQK